MPEKKFVFSIYKIRKNTPYSEVYSSKVTPSFDQTITINDREFRLIVSNNNRAIPEWLKEITRIGNASIIQFVASAGGVLEVKTETNDIYCITFGAKGRFLLNHLVIEERFGLITALNMIGDNPIRQINKTTLDSNQKHSKEQLSKEGSAKDFGINYMQDILMGVTGKPSMEGDFLRVAGTDSLNISTRFGYNDIYQLIEIIHAQSLTDKYKERYGWIDKFSIVKDKVILDQLDGCIDAWLAIPQADSIGWFSLPQAIEWERILGIYFSGSTERSEIFPDIDLIHLREAWREETLTVALLKKRQAHAINVEGDAIPEYAWPLYKCLYFEALINGDQFILSDGKWYKTEPDYSKELNQYYSSLEWADLSLMKYNHKSEGLYNSAIKGRPHIAVYDKKLSYISGEDPIEFCDLFEETQKQMIHVKRYGQSAVLSHLFAQGYVSAELIFGNSKVRRAVLVNESSRGIDLGFTEHDRLDPSKYIVVYAIISTSSERTPQVPYFSKISLRNYCEKLKSIGFVVKMAKIECEDGIQLKSKRPRKRTTNVK